MKRRLMITVDVEALTGRAPSNHVERLIYGRFSEGEYGIGTIMSIAERHGISLVMFLDYVEEILYGESILDVGRDILRRGHDLQLHMHPDIFPVSFFNRIGLKRSTDLTCVTSVHARHFLDYVLNLHAKISGNLPAAFRGGSYRFGEGILTALAGAGIPINSSYNPSRDNQPLYIGARKQFYWDTGTLELPISCIYDVKQTRRLLDYNFNNKPLSSRSISNYLESHRHYLDTFYRTFGVDAVAVLVMHSWSFMIKDKAGHFSIPNPTAVERFNLLLESLKESVEIVTATDIAKLSAAGGMPAEVLSFSQTPRLNNPYAMIPTGVSSAINHCPVCYTPFSQFEDINGKSMCCPTCGALEHQRVFVVNYQNKRFPALEIQGKRVLIISPSAAELRFLRTIEDLELVTLDIDQGIKSDIVADICAMPQVTDESFDVIITSYTNKYVHDLNACFCEFKRILKPTGLLLHYDPVSYKIGHSGTFGGKDNQQILARHFVVQKVSCVDAPSRNLIFWNVCSKALPGPERASCERGSGRIRKITGRLKTILFH